MSRNIWRSSVRHARERRRDERTQHGEDDEQPKQGGIARDAQEGAVRKLAGSIALDVRLVSDYCYIILKLHYYY